MRTRSRASLCYSRRVVVSRRSRMRIIVSVIIRIRIRMRSSMRRRTNRAIIRIRCTRRMSRMRRVRCARRRSIRSRRSRRVRVSCVQYYACSYYYVYDASSYAE